LGETQGSKGSPLPFSLKGWDKSRYRTGGYKPISQAYSLQKQMVSLYDRALPCPLLSQAFSLKNGSGDNFAKIKFLTLNSHE